jgi:uncharacterized protein YkwD
MHGAEVMRISRASALFIVAALVLGCANLPIAFPAPSGTGSGTGTGDAGGPSPSVAADLVRYTNDARTKNGLSALRSNSRLMDAARIHAAQMAANQRSDHTISGAQYPTMQSRLDAVGYAYVQAAENVAWNQQSAQAVVTTWMNSSGHRANILDPGLTEMGAAMARSSRGEPYWIQVFGRPR